MLISRLFAHLLYILMNLIMKILTLKFSWICI